MAWFLGKPRDTLLVFMLMFSAAAHCGLLYVSWWQPVPKTQMASGGPVRVVLSVAPPVEESAPQPEPPVKQVRHDPLPEVDLADTMAAPPELAKPAPREAVEPAPEPEAITPPDPVRQPVPQSPPAPTPERVVRHHIRPVAEKNIRKSAPKRAQRRRTGERSAQQREGAPSGGPAAGGSGGKAGSGVNQGRKTSGSGDSVAKAEMARYLQNILKKIERNKYYPQEARSRRLQGKTTVSFHLLANGRIRRAAIAHHSGYGVLDRAAIRAVKRSAPFPPRPDGGAGGPTVLEVVISFQLSR